MRLVFIAVLARLAVFVSSEHVADDFETFPRKDAVYKPGLRPMEHKQFAETMRNLQDTPDQLPVIELILQTFVLNLMEAYTAFAKVVDDMSGDGPFTIFPPWDSGFRALGPDLVSKLQRRPWNAHLQNLLRYHMYDGDIPFDSFENQTITMKNGEDLVLTQVPDEEFRIRANGDPSIGIYNALNGHAYILNEVLLPEWVRRTLFDLALGSFSKLSSLVVMAGFEADLRDSDASLTIFAPSDEAFTSLFTSLGDTAVAYLYSDDGRPVLRRMLQYHISPRGPYPSLYFVERTLPTLLQGESIKLKTGSPNVVEGKVNQASITILDQPAKNGLVHTIDSVLLLDASPPEDSPTRTPLSPSPTTPSPTFEPVFFPDNNPRPSTWRQTGGPFSSSVTNPIGIGTSVSIAGSYAAVGIPLVSDADDGLPVGGTLLFQKSGGSWRLAETLVENGPELRALGTAVHLSRSGDRYGLLAGAPGTISSDGVARGGAYYRELSGNTWESLGGVLRPPQLDNSADSNYGAAVSSEASRRRLVVGAPEYDLSPNSRDNGRIFIYLYRAPDFVEVGTSLYGRSAGARFGAAVAMASNGEVVVVGAPGASGAAPGAVHVYIESSGSWTEDLYVEGTESDNLGASVAILDDVGRLIAVGAPGYISNRGLVRVYHRGSNGWVRLGGNVVGAVGESLGTTVAGNTENVVVGTAASSFGTFRSYRVTENGLSRIANEIPLISPPVSLAVDGRDIVVGEQIQAASFYERKDVASPTGPAPPFTPPVDTPRPTASPTITPSPTRAPTPITPAPVGSVGAWVADTGRFSVPNAQFGRSIAIAGDQVAVGATSLQGNGGVIMFQKMMNIWTAYQQVFQVTLRNVGSAVDLSYSAADDRYGLLVGAPESTGPVNDPRGGVRYHELVEGNWRTFGNVLRPPVTQSAVNSHYGAAVGVDSGSRRLVVGAPEFSTGNGSVNGRVFAYEIRDTEIAYEFPVGALLSGESAGDRFGAALDMAKGGRRFVVGAPGAQGVAPGKMYIYTEISGSWTLSFAASGGGNLGTSVVFLNDAGTRVAVGAPGYETNRGFVRVYEETSGSWSPLGGDIVGSTGEFLGKSMGGNDRFLVLGNENGTFKTFYFNVDEWEEAANEVTLGKGRPASPVVAVDVDGSDLVVTQEDESASFYRYAS